jgi:hypothetical protein
MELSRFDLENQAIQRRIATALEKIARALEGETPHIKADFTAGLVAGTLERIAKAVEKINVA